MKPETKRDLAGLGEFGFIARMARPFVKSLPAGVEGIGVDCAVLPWTKRERLLVTTDMLIEGRHFIRKRIAPADLGYKALAVNLSDIAAMGGRPRWALLSIGIPAGIELDWLDGFFKGWREAAKPSGVRLVGGDTTKSPGGIVINVVVIGAIRAGREKLRSTARVSDVIAVTGKLGDSGAGLRILLGEDRLAKWPEVPLAPVKTEVRIYLEDLENNTRPEADRANRLDPLDKDEARLVRAHNRPRPHLEEGEWLAARAGVRAMMDVSDGIDSDLRRIMERSKVGADVNLEKLPLSPALVRVARRRRFDPIETAAAGGEDYCLLLTVAPESFESLSAAFARRFSRPLWAVGTIRPKSSGLRYFLHGRRTRLRSRGFDHFKSVPGYSFPEF